MAKQDYWICPSILSANFTKLKEEVTSVLDAGCDRIHIDVMDNHYVPNLTFGPLVVEALRKEGVTAPLDVHLMVEPVDDLIKRFAEAKASCIVFHPEASRHVDRSLQLIKQYDIDAGLVLNPSTDPSVLKYVIDRIDRILIMSVNPGFGGQTFIDSALDKIAVVRDMIDQSNYSIRLEVDGGVNKDNIAKIAQAGADTFVAGNAVFSMNDYQQAIQNLKNALKNS
ncbi:ribulose-phosphate 3-epimerase [Thiotrichales bacterium 19S11-10]|nr:ribulose-phosphate 3-epimerase [Thiotrichales bacterium 19S11-10]MCF6808044.1 ribulose-phosphate 3-epimerase [Thiotrichales bacterium 19S9-11]MCF6812059.1 ribulose-phosphate 3-epimerase [Thiotrichales bacterium 19S9-12]